MQEGAFGQLEEETGLGPWVSRGRARDNCLVPSLRHHPSLRATTHFRPCQGAPQCHLLQGTFHHPVLGMRTLPCTYLSLARPEAVAEEEELLRLDLEVEGAAEEPAQKQRCLQAGPWRLASRQIWVQPEYLQQQQQQVA